MAILYDFRKKIIEDTRPPQEEIWRDWSDEVREVARSNGWNKAPATGVSVQLKAMSTGAPHARLYDWVHSYDIRARAFIPFMKTEQIRLKKYSRFRDGRSSESIRKHADHRRGFPGKSETAGLQEQVTW